MFVLFVWHAFTLVGLCLFRNVTAHWAVFSPVFSYRGFRIHFSTCQGTNQCQSIFFWLTQTGIEATGIMANADYHQGSSDETNLSKGSLSLAAAKSGGHGLPAASQPEPCCTQNSQDDGGSPTYWELQEMEMSAYVEQMEKRSQGNELDKKPETISNKIDKKRTASFEDPTDASQKMQKQ